MKIKLTHGTDIKNGVKILQVSVIEISIIVRNNCITKLISNLTIDNLIKINKYKYFMIFVIFINILTRLFAGHASTRFTHALALKYESTTQKANCIELEDK